MSLKHWWQLNGSLVDCVGGNDLVASGAFSSNDSGKIGRCYFASATSAYAASKNTIYRNGDLSLCFWFKLTAFAESPTALVTLHDHTTTSNIGINLGSSNKLGISIGYTDGSREWSARNSTTVITLNTWYHACVTFNQVENRITVYVNGVKENSEVLTKTVKFTADKLTVNRWSVDYGGYMSTCYYNDIRFYDHALSAKEVKEISKGLMLHYDFNNIKDGKVKDNSGFKNNSTFKSGSVPSIATDSGMGSASLLFKNASKQSNGLYQHTISDSAVYIPEEGTLSYYIKYDTTNYAENSDNKYAVGYANFCSMNNPSALGMIYYKDASNYESKTTSNTTKDGKWHMHTISWNKSTKAFKNYVDGVLVQSATVTAFQHAGTFRNFIVGSAWSDSYGGHSGYLDDVRVYATQLSDNDVTELYKVKGSVSKNGKLFVNEICELGFKTKTAYDATWARIFYHNNKSGAVVFSNDKEEFLNCHTADKESNLWALDKFKNKDGKIELLLEYDGITGYNRWKQSSNFTKETAISGYEAVAISWTSSGWNGLALSQDSGSTWVDGSPNSGTSSWWYAIGCKTNYNGGIPGPNTTIATSGLSLWARIDNLQTNSIDKQGVLYTNEIVEVENCSMKTKTENNANWVRLFYHNSKSGTVLFDKNNKAEFLKCHTEDKQSDLWALEQFRGKDGKFELLLQYQNSTGYNRWKQSSNFTKEKIAGYEAVQVSWTSSYWGGLETDGSNAFVDGSVNHGNWYYAIGPFSNYQNGMPNASGVEAGWVEIWVRCDDINLFRMIKNGKCKATEFIEI